MSSSGMMVRQTDIIFQSFPMYWHMLPWSTKPVISHTGIFVAIANIVWVKSIDFFNAKNQ